MRARLCIVLENVEIFFTRFFRMKVLRIAQLPAIFGFDWELAAFEKKGALKHAPTQKPNAGFVEVILLLLRGL
jgi:hypothetical protein